MITAAAPPMSSQIALSVGLPLKNRDTSELKDCVALNPNINKTTPTAKTAKPTIFVMN
jgi:hypothetical protein